MDKTEVSKKIKRNRKGNKIKFPKLSIEEAVGIIKKVKDDYGDEIIPYKRFAKDILGQKFPKGGTYQIKIEALRLYRLMDRRSYSEIGILPDGSKILDAENEEEIKKLMFERVLSVPIIKKVYDRFKKKLPQKKQPIVDFLIGESMDQRDASRLSNMIMKDYKTFQPFIPLYLTKAIVPETDDTAKEQIKDVDKDTETGERVEGLAPLIRIIGSLFPLESDKETDKKLETLSKLAKDHNLKTFYGLIEGLKISYDPEKLKDISEKIILTFQEDSGIKMVEDGDLKEKEKGKPADKEPKVEETPESEPKEEESSEESTEEQ